MRLSLRRMLALVAVLAVPLAFWGWRLRAGVPFPAGLDVATSAVTLVSACLVAKTLIGASRDRPRFLGSLGWGLLSLNAVVAIWFTSVEWSFVVENCPACGHGRDISESCFFSVIRRRLTREIPTITELIASDLGIPCNHELMRGWQKYRLFGGCLWGERHPGIHRLGDGLWYPPCARAAVRSWSTQDPSFIRIFRERALEAQDRQYVRTLVFRVYDACPAEQLPAYPPQGYHRAAGLDLPASDMRNR
jgi:hypothetical protein